MPLYAYRGKRPQVAPDAFIAPSAVLIGDVTVRSGASVWFGTVLRGDMDRIEIGERSNVQDNSTIHTDTGEPTIIGPDVTIGHNALVHSSIVARNVLVRQAAVLVGGNTVGEETVIGAGADDRPLTDRVTSDEHRGLSDEDVACDDRRVNERVVADRHVRADDRRLTRVGVDGGVVLHVGALADLDAIHVAAKHR